MLYNIGANLVSAVPSVAVDVVDYRDHGANSAFQLEPVSEDEIVVNNLRGYSSLGVDSIPIDTIRANIFSLMLSKLVPMAFLPKEFIIFKVWPIFENFDEKTKIAM